MSSTIKDSILDVAEQLAQTRGFNSFSYADVASKLRVTKPSLHYHFPSKADLGRALVSRYRANFGLALDAIQRTERDPRRKLKRYADLYDAVLRKNRMCLCGMFAAEFATLPTPMQDELRSFFDSNERWLAGVLAAGREDGTLSFKEQPKERARMLLGALEGAMLIARAFGDGRRFRVIVEQVLADVSANSARALSRTAV
jgi:TetR/AcrR family transcriptional regulator, transcriptional repressor for nem operon